MADLLSPPPPKPPTFASSLGMAIAYVLIAGVSGIAARWLWHHWEVAAGIVVLLLIAAIIHAVRLFEYRDSPSWVYPRIPWPRVQWPPMRSNLKPDGHFDGHERGPDPMPMKPYRDDRGGH